MKIAKKFFLATLKLALVLPIVVSANPPIIAAQTSASLVQSQDKHTQALKKIDELKALITKAQQKDIDTSREECTVWMSEFFLKCANWDEENTKINEDIYKKVPIYKEQATELAKALPDTERDKVIQMLDISTKQLQDEVDGKIKRRPIPSINWENIEVKDGNFVSDGNIVFPFDYTWKDQTTLGNQYLGNMSSVLADLNFVSGEDEKGYTVDPNRTEVFKNPISANAGMFRMFHTPKFNEYLEKNHSDLRQGLSLFTKYDIDNPETREMWTKILEELVPLSVDKKYIDFGYLLANEPHWFSSQGSWYTDSQGEGKISEHTLNGFRSWLESKHKDIGTLNSLWHTDFKDFDSVTIELPLAKELIYTPMGYDWSTYNMIRVTNWFEFLHDNIKEHNPDANTHIKVMTGLFAGNDKSHGIDFEAFANINEIIGDDATILPQRKFTSTEPEKWEENYSYKWNEMAMGYDFMHSVSPGKAQINSENHFISGNSFRDKDMTADYIRSTFWLSAMHGLDCNYIWVWYRNADGSITDKGLTKSPGYPGTIAQAPTVVNEISQATMDLAAFGKEVDAFQKQRKPLRIFYSKTNAINQPEGMDHVFELYEEMYFNGVPLGFATEGIINKRPHSEWDTIVVRDAKYVTDSEFDALQEYINQGGTIIIDDVSLKLNEYGQERTKKLAQKGEGKLITVKEGSVEAMADQAFSILDQKGSMPEISLTEDNGGTQEGCNWRVIPDEEGYTVFITNIGCREAKLSLAAVNEKEIIVQDMLTEAEHSTSFTMSPQETKLLHIEYK